MASRTEGAGRESQRRMVFLLGISASCLAAGIAGWWLVFGFLTWALLASCFAVGFGKSASRRPVSSALAAIFLVLCALLAGMAWLDRPEGPLRLWGGLPAATALLVYGIWPFGVTAGALYAWVFHRSVLPEEKLRAFLQAHRRPQD